MGWKILSEQYFIFEETLYTMISSIRREQCPSLPRATILLGSRQCRSTETSVAYHNGYFSGVAIVPVPRIELHYFTHSRFLFKNNRSSHSLAQ